VVSQAGGVLLTETVRTVGLDAELSAVRTVDRSVHVHVCAEGSDWERRHLLFRDWLRHDKSDREAYASLKRELATRDWPDMNAYAAAKGTMIAEITARAEEWAARAVDWNSGPRHPSRGVSGATRRV
jgi:GrpB-like predicted nucleotidyltransferase (UPF0157 family)